MKVCLRCAIKDDLCQIRITIAFIIMNAMEYIIFKFWDISHAQHWNTDIKYKLLGQEPHYFKTIA